ncbi:MAG: hypothetical protein H6740_27220 [Alphaproteobacteria bacterium]|nr:hypothetical protein [Alphaproteobacteria bacterium]
MSRSVVLKGRVHRGPDREWGIRRSDTGDAVYFEGWRGAEVVKRACRFFMPLGGPWSSVGLRLTVDVSATPREIVECVFAPGKRSRVSVLMPSGGLAPLELRGESPGDVLMASVSWNQGRPVFVTDEGEELPFASDDEWWRIWRLTSITEKDDRWLRGRFRVLRAQVGDTWVVEVLESVIHVDERHCHTIQPSEDGFASMDELLSDVGGVPRVQ